MGRSAPEIWRSPRSATAATGVGTGPASRLCLEWLFYVGEVTSAYRNSQFERVYDLPERVIPSSVLAMPTPTPQESVTGLIRRAARALGIASESVLTRLLPHSCGNDARRRSRHWWRVVSSSRSWSQGSGNRPWYLWHEARVPRRIDARALLSPFDSMIFERARLERLFDFVYRIEIYVPEPKRVHGYYVYPFLLDEQFVARVDLKADRARGVLRVNAAWIEPAMTRMTWQPSSHLSSRSWPSGSAWRAVEILPRGDLAPALAAAVDRWSSSQAASVGNRAPTLLEERRRHARERSERRLRRSRTATTRRERSARCASSNQKGAGLTMEGALRHFYDG